VERPDTRQIWNANAAAWTELSRGGFDRYRDLVNTPAFFGLLPPVDGLLCLDLGCGEGYNTRLLAGRGARVVAVDVAELFIAAAAGEDRHGIRYLLGDGAVLPFRASAFDAVTAFMSLMDVADPERTLREIARVLRPGGFVQFSVVHPVIGAPVGRWVNDESGVRQARAIGDYFYEGPLTETWSFGNAPAELRDRHRPFTITYARRTLRSPTPGSPRTSSWYGPGGRDLPLLGGAQDLAGVRAVDVAHERRVDVVPEQFLEPFG